MKMNHSLKIQEVITLSKQNENSMRLNRRAVNDRRKLARGRCDDVLEFCCIRTVDETAILNRMNNGLRPRAHNDDDNDEDGVDERFAHYAKLDAAPETIVMKATLAGRLVGLGAFTMDGPLGLHVDDEFKAQSKWIRAEGLRLASSYCVADEWRNVQHHEIMMGLLKEMICLALESGIESLLFVFQKQHESIYEKMFNLKFVAEAPDAEHCADGSHSIFMRCDIADQTGLWAL